MDPDKWIRRKDFQGVSLKAVVVVSTPFVQELIPLNDGSGNFKMTGMNADIIYSLASKMNFTLSLKTFERVAGVELPNGSWTGMIGQLYSNKVDIIPQDWVVRLQRTRGMDYMLPYKPSYSMFVIKNPLDSYHFTAYIEPLNWMAWGVTAIWCIVAPLFLYFVIWYGRKDPAAREFALGQSYVFCIGLLGMRTWPCTPVLIKSRVAFLSLLVVGMLVYWHWEAMLISNLAARVIVLPFTDFAGLVRHEDYKILVKRESFFEDIFRDAKDPLWQKAWTEKVEPYLEDYPIVDNDELIKMTAADSSLALIEGQSAVKVSPEYRACKIIQIPGKVQEVQVAFALAKNSPYLGVFNHFMLQMTESGELQRILQRYEAPPQVCPDYSGKPVGFNNCFTAFVVLFIGVGAAAALFSLEHINYLKKTQQQ